MTVVAESRFLFRSTFRTGEAWVIHIIEEASRAPSATHWGPMQDQLRQTTGMNSVTRKEFNFIRRFFLYNKQCLETVEGYACQIVTCIEGVGILQSAVKRAGCPAIGEINPGRGESRKLSNRLEGVAQGRSVHPLQVVPSFDNWECGLPISSITEGGRES